MDVILVLLCHTRTNRLGAVFGGIAGDGTLETACLHTIEEGLIPLGIAFGLVARVREMETS